MLILDAGRAVELHEAVEHEAREKARRRRYAVEVEAPWVLRPTPGPVVCVTCRRRFRPGRLWLDAHGEVCADCLDPIPGVRFDCAADGCRTLVERPGERCDRHPT